MAMRLTAAMVLVMKTLVGGKLSEYHVESKKVELTKVELTKDLLCIGGLCFRKIYICT